MNPRFTALLFVLPACASDPEPPPPPSKPEPQELVEQMGACAAGLRGASCRLDACAAWWSSVEAYERRDTRFADPYPGSTYGPWAELDGTHGCLRRAGRQLVRKLGAGDEGYDMLSHVSLNVLYTDPDVFRVALDDTLRHHRRALFDELPTAQRALGPTPAAGQLLPDVYEALLAEPDPLVVQQGARWMVLAWPPVGVPLAVQLTGSAGRDAFERRRLTSAVLNELERAEIAKPVLARSLEPVRTRCQAREPGDDWLDDWCTFATEHPLPPPPPARERW